MIGWRHAALLAVLLSSAALPARAADDTLPPVPPPSRPAAAPAAQAPAAERPTADLATLGPLSGTIPLGTTGHWTVSVDEGRLIVAGAGGEDDVWTAFPPFGRDRAAGLEGSVRVEADGSAAGLAFDVAPDVDGFLAWVATGDGKVALMRKVKGAVARVSTYDIPGGRREAGDLLQVRQNADGARLLVNGRLVTSLSWADESDLNGNGAFGTVAIGPGRRAFRNFAVGDAPPGAFGPPAGRRPADAPAASPATPVPAAAAPPSDAQRLASLGPLAAQVGLGPSGAWTSGADRGRLVLANPAKPGAVRSYETAWQGDAGKGRSVGVRVRVDGRDRNAAAGLILRLADGDPNWVAWVVTGDGRYALYARDEKGLHVVNADAIPGGPRADGDLLQMSQEGDRIAVFLDGTFLARSPAGGKAPAAGAPVGVMAMGEGTFTIGDFAFGPALAAAEPPAKTGQDDTVPDPMPNPPPAQAGGPARPEPVPAAPKVEGSAPPTPPAPPARTARRDVPELGPLGGDVDLGSNGSWTSAEEGGRFVLSNTTDGDAIDYYTLGWRGTREAGRSFSARVESPPDGGSAGLVFGYDDKAERAILFIVSPDRKASVVALRKGKADAVATLTLGGIRPAEGDLLAIEQVGGNTVLRADGEVVATLSPNDGRGLDDTGTVGIAAAGTGRFAFHAVAFGPGGTDAAAGGAANPAVPKLPKFQAGGRLTHFSAETFGATLGILAHEFGHFMIGELKIPATGPEEDVADEFAAMVFVDNIRNDPQTAIGPALGAAKFWWYEAEDHGDNATPWYDEHAPDRARFAKFMCMLYGADPQAFGPVMDAAGIPDRSKQRCLADEPKRQRAWTTLLRPYRRAGVDPIEPGDLDPATPGHRITVEYQPSKNPALQPFAEEVRKSGVFDYLAAYVSAVYVLPRDTKIVFKDCGIENCWYQGDTGDVTMCWEMIGSVLGTFRKHEAQVAQAGGGQPNQTGGASRPTPPAPPANSPPPAAGQPVTLAQFMQGRWHSLFRSAEGPQEGFFELDPQGRYAARIRTDTPNGPFVLSVEGSWSVAPQGGTHVRLVLSPSNWSPRQFCRQQGQCTPIALQAQASEIEIVDRDTLRSAAGESKRMP